MDILTDEHKKLIESLDDIKKVYGAYVHENGATYLRIKTSDGTNSTRGLRSTLRRCGVSMPVDSGTCIQCENQYTKIAPNQKYCSKQCSRLFRKDNMALSSRKSVVKRYGMSLDEYDNLLKSQKGLCKICKEKPKRIVIDHCHTTGLVRGLLCVRCNSCLGWYEKYLKEAKTYLHITSPS